MTRRPDWCPHCGEYMWIYGFGAPRDPRDFIPDDECVTPAEWVCWAEDCHRASAGETVETPPNTCRQTSYGLGTYFVGCDCR